MPRTPAPASVSAAMRPIGAAVRRCGVGAPPGEDVTFRVVFDSGGNVSAVTVGQHWAGTAVDSCVVRAVREVHLPPFSSPTWATSFTYWLCC